MAEETTERAAGSNGGSIFLRKTGPLANWIWMAILLLLALVYSLWKRNQAGAGAEELDGPVVEDVPGNQTPPPVFILPQNPQPTVPVNVVVNNPGTPPTAPPAGGRPNPPPVVKPKPTAPSKTPAVAYDTVSVVKYTSKNPPANSTLWGIAKSKGYGSAGNNWQAIWNDPKNAALKKKRGSPDKIQPGDKVYVRRK